MAAVDAATLPEYRGKHTEIDNVRMLHWTGVGSGKAGPS